MKTVDVSLVKQAIKEAYIKMNYELGPDILEALEHYNAQETSPIGKNIFESIFENLEIAKSDRVPICQDTGMAVLFLELGQEVALVGGDINEAINQGVREAYEEGYLRKSVVNDPLLRENTKDNTPAIIHYNIVSGDQIKIMAMAKGFGSENMSQIKMLKPSDGEAGMIDFVVQVVKEAGPNPCPPVVVGVGVGGDFEKAALMAKKALSRNIGSENKKSNLKRIEKVILEKLNKLGIGPQGLGGDTTAFSVHIEDYPTHIAGLPVAVNINCHVSRHIEIEL